MTRSTLLLILAALPLAAQTKNLNCDDRDSSRHDRAQFCEMREQTIAPAGRLAIDGRQNGGISVKGWDQNQVLVRAQVSASGTNDGDARARAAQVIVHASGGQVTADGPSGGEWWVSFEVFVPRQTDLNLKAHNGGIHIEDVRGQMEFETVNGGVHLANVGGDVRGHTQNGGVHVDLSGNAWDGRGLEVTTQNGGVHMNVPAHYSAHLETSTVNGGVKNDFAEVQAVKRDRQLREFNTNIGAGGATVRVVTTNGGVTIARI